MKLTACSIVVYDECDQEDILQDYGADYSWHPHHP